AIGRFQRMARDPPAVDERAVAAAAVLQDEMAVFRHDARVVARGPAVADDEGILGVPANPKRNGVEFDAGPVSGGGHYDQGCRMRHRRRGMGFHHSRTLGAERAGTARDEPRLRACCISSKRKTWQCEQYPPTSVRASRI